MPDLRQIQITNLLRLNEGVQHVDRQPRMLLDEAAAEGLSDTERIAVRRAVGAAIVRTRDLHPNLLAVLERVQERTGDPGETIVDDPDLFLESLADLDEGAQNLTLRVLTLCIIIDGRMSRPERRLLAEAQEAAGRPADLAPARRSRRLFVTGQDFVL